MASRSYDVIIVGGGVIGSATAYYLTLADRGLSVAVVERDPTYARASSALSMANVRIQFTLEQNVIISRYAMEVLGHFEQTMAVDGERPSLAYRREGNLFVCGAAQRKDAEAALAMQQRLGARVRWWSPARIRERYPLYRPQDYSGGTFGADDGHIDAYGMLMAYRRKARSQGAAYIRAEVVQILVGGRRVEGVRLADGQRLHSGQVVNCSGAWASETARTAGVELPVQPVKRQVFVLDPAEKPAGPLPLTVLPSGLYFRTETGGRLLLGKSLPEDPVGFDFSWDDKRFMELLWPELAEFAPAFDTAKLMRGWAGLYAVNTLDGNAIIGQWPQLSGFYLANGFSGHGLQQAPAVGRHLSELLLRRPPSLDLSVFAPERILEGRPLSESGLV